MVAFTGRVTYADHGVARQRSDMKRSQKELIELTDPFFCDLSFSPHASMPISAPQLTDPGAQPTWAGLLSGFRGGQRRHQPRPCRCTRCYAGLLAYCTHVPV